jgi:predicted Zn-dependent peptidase
MRVVTEEIPHVRSVAVGVWIDVGSRDEDALRNGISHFIEHMVFKGTKKRSLKAISRSIESVGGYLNAFTSKEHTCYYARVLDEYTGLAIDVLADLALNPLFPEKDLEKEKGVVIEELRNAEDDPDDIIHDYLEKALYGIHPLGFPVIGTENNLRSFTKEMLAEYRTRHYIPSRMVVSAAGNVQHNQFLELVSKNLPSKGRSPLFATRRKPQSQKGKSIDVDKPIQQAHVCLGTLGFSIKSKERYPLLVLNTLLGDGMSSRLFQNVRERYGFAYNVYSFANMLSDSGSFGVYVGTDKAHIEASTDLIMRELHKLRAAPVSKAELSRTKAQLKGSMMLSLESIPHRMMRLGSSELYFGELTPLDSLLSQIDNVDAGQVQHLAQELFKEEQFSKIIFRPDMSKADRSLGAANLAAVNP